MEIIVTTPDELQKFIKKTLSELFSENSTKSTASNRPLTVEQAALYLNLPKPTLYQLTSQRTIPFRKVGRRLSFLQSELDSWLMENRKKTRSEIESQSLNHTKR